MCHEGVARNLEPDLVYGFSGIVDEVSACVAFLVQCGGSDLSIICVKEREDEWQFFVDLSYDGVRDYCKPFFVVGGEQEVGQLLFELVDVFEVRGTCNVLSFVGVDFTLGHAVKCREISRIYWADIEIFWGNEVVRLRGHDKAEFAVLFAST